MQIGNIMSSIGYVPVCTRHAGLLFTLYKLYRLPIVLNIYLRIRGYIFKGLYILEVPVVVEKIVKS